MKCKKSSCEFWWNNECTYIRLSAYRQIDYSKPVKVCSTVAKVELKNKGRDIREFPESTSK